MDIRQISLQVVECLKWTSICRIRVQWLAFGAGPKDIVVIGRAAGRLTGKAVGYIQTARGHLDPILQRSEINTVGYLISCFMHLIYFLEGHT